MERINALSPSDLIKKVVAIVLDVLLTSVENFLITGLDIMQAVTEGLLDVLDAPIQIPVLSNIYQSIAHADLSLLDLACLIGAIPATLIYKLAVHRAPFPDTPATTALSQAGDFVALQRAVGVNQALAHGAAADMTTSAVASAPVPSDTLATVTVVLDIVALLGAGAVAIITDQKRELPEGVISTPLNVFASVAYLPYIGPNIAAALSATYGAWYTIMNDLVTGLALVKTLADNVKPLASFKGWTDIASPWLETALNALWLVPAAAQFYELQKPAVSDKLGLTSNVFFDVGGIITPSTLKLYWPELPEPGPEIASTIAFKSALLLTILYGFFSSLAGAELLDGN